MVEELETRLARLRNVPWELIQYERWLQEQPRGPREYLFAERRARFELRAEDCLLPMPGLELSGGKHLTRLSVQGRGVVCELPKVDAGLVEGWLQSMDGETPFVVVRRSARAALPQLRQFVDAALGSVLFVPAAVHALERRTSATELVRFPGSPYQVVRSYWSNSADITEYLAMRWTASETFTGTSLRELLCSVHVLLTIGADSLSYYKPASPMSDRAVMPGALMDRGTHVVSHGGRRYFLSGPRVGAVLLGGPRYQQLLAESLEDEHAVNAERVHTVDGLHWGSVVFGVREEEDQPASWFCPPRPMQHRHFEQLAHSLNQACVAAAMQDQASFLRSLAHFHQQVVRLHPFHCGNQGVGMAIVNSLLRAVRGTGIPHLLLDMFALRFSPQAYATLFARAVEQCSGMGSDPVARLHYLIDGINQGNALVTKIAAAESLEEARSLALGEAAPWALLG